jgi:hypothetical protein
MSDSRAFAYSFGLIILLACAGKEPAAQPAASGAQSFEQALELICDVDELRKKEAPDAEEDAMAVGRLRTRILNERVESPDGIFLLTMLSVKGAKEQAALLRKELAAAGGQRCRLADSLEADELGALSP